MLSPYPGKAITLSPSISEQLFFTSSLHQRSLCKLHSEEDVLKDDVKLLLQPLKSHVPEVQEQGI